MVSEGTPVTTGDSHLDIICIRTVRLVSRTMATEELSRVEGREEGPG